MEQVTEEEPLRDLAPPGSGRGGVNRLGSFFFAEARAEHFGRAAEILLWLIRRLRLLQKGAGVFLRYNRANARKIKAAEKRTGAQLAGPSDVDQELHQGVAHFA